MDKQKQTQQIGTIMRPCSNCEESPKDKMDAGHVEQPELCSIFV